MDPSHNPAGETRRPRKLPPAKIAHPNSGSSGSDEANHHGLVRDVASHEGSFDHSGAAIPSAHRSHGHIVGQAVVETDDVRYGGVQFTSAHHRSVSPGLNNRGKKSGDDGTQKGQRMTIRQTPH